MPVRFVPLALLACLLYGLIGYSAHPKRSQPIEASNGRSYTLEKATLNDKIIAGGEMLVGEEIAVNFNGRFTGFYRDIPLFPNQEILDVKVSDNRQRYKQEGSAALGSSGRPGTWAEDRPQDDIYRIVWHHQTNNKTRAFTSNYRLTNATERFRGGDVIRIRLWGQYWPGSLNRLTTTLTLPTTDKAKLTTSPAWLDPQVSQQGNKITATVNRIPAERAVDLLVVLPRGSLGPGVPIKDGPLPQINRSPSDNFYAWSTPIKRFLVWLAAIALVGFAIALAWIFVWKRICRDDDKIAEGVVYQPPAKQSLVLGYTSAEEKTPPTNQAIVATLIDLIARGYYERENVRDQAGNWRLQIALPTKRQSGSITKGEAAVMQYFDRLLIAGPCIVDELDGRVSPTREDQVRYQNMTEALMADTTPIQSLQKSHVATVKVIAIAWLLFICWLTAVLTVPSGMITGGYTLAVVVTILIIVAFASWPRKDFVHSGSEAMIAASQWRGWRDFILTFSSMETAPDLQVILWERAFAGALLFGVAEDFAERAKVLVPNLPSQGTALSTPSFYGGSLASSPASSSSPPPSSAGGGSGGGGGGGGSGGGGGGAW